jgi:salicylate hydroxylase
MERPCQINRLLRLYEDIRKDRTKTNVAGAVGTRHYYHLPDGDEQRRRDAELASLPDTNWQGRCSFNWGDSEYQKALLGFDVLKHARERFEQSGLMASSGGLKAKI